jgi:hypothetical protein
MIGKSRTCAVLALAQLTGAVATMKLRSGLKMSASGGAKGLRMPQPATLATSAALVSTGAVFVRSKMTQTTIAVAANPKMAEGLAYSFAALCGNTAASLLRKQVSRSSKVKPAEQVGLATALQGIVACAYCAQQGLFSTAVTSAFLVPAVGSAVLNALTKTLETKAYAITDVSLCAPFLAFDPVMQFLLPVLTRRPAVLRRLHAIDARRLRETRSDRFRDVVAACQRDSDHIDGVFTRQRRRDAIDAMPTRADASREWTEAVSRDGINQHRPSSRRSPADSWESAAA